MKIESPALSIELTREEVLNDYRLAFRSRMMSVIGRREVLTGKAQFGIFGGGKEVAQIALAKFFQPGDFRSGYYRDQTWMLATGMVTLKQLFAELYADADLEREPASGGRQMNAHFATRLLHPDGSWRNLTELPNSSADTSPTGSQMPRLVGLAYASRLYRELDELKHLTQFSRNGNEIAWGAIGNASCAEGMFWETVNAIGVLRSPAIISIWDDEYGISVPQKYQITKGNLSVLLSGFQREPGSDEGFDVYTVRGWDYPALIEVYQRAARIAREEHIPAIIHVIELTQPQGHSTSGSHERYKSKERLEWERELDCIRKFREWIVSEGYATEEEMDEIEAEDRRLVENIRAEAYEEFLAPIKAERAEFCDILDEIASSSRHADELAEIRRNLMAQQVPTRKAIFAAVRKALTTLRDEPIPAKQVLLDWKARQLAANEDRFSSHLYSQSAENALNVPEVPPRYSENSPEVPGYEVLNACFDAMLARDPRVIFFGEDVGFLGGVNQALKGLQARYGELRVTDTGIRETTIVGQAIGMAMRGLRPVAELQYLDYVLFGLQTMSDDLATLHWRTKGGQKAPVIIRTRGHRLVGIWHSGSLMAGIIHLCRGMHVLVPRNMVQAAGFYNTLLASDEPGIIVEVLNGYRLKERLPDNIAEFTVPLGKPEVLRPGRDVTLVTYGACCRIVNQAADLLSELDIEAEVIDVQSLLPFDRYGVILESLKKTNRIVFIDEDVPGGTTAYMMQEVLERQGGFEWLDTAPLTIPAKPHRPSYGVDGDYFSKPSVEEVFEKVYGLMHEVNPRKYPLFF